MNNSLGYAGLGGVDNIIKFIKQGNILYYYKCVILVLMLTTL